MPSKRDKERLTQIATYRRTFKRRISELATEGGASLLAVVKNWIKPRTAGAKASVPRLDVAAQFAHERDVSLDWLAGLSERRSLHVEFLGVDLGAELRAHLAARLVDAKRGDPRLVELFLPREDEILAEVEDHFWRQISSMARFSRGEMRQMYQLAGDRKAAATVAEMPRTAERGTTTAEGGLLASPGPRVQHVRRIQAKESDRAFVAELRKRARSPRRA